MSEKEGTGEVPRKEQKSGRFLRGSRGRVLTKNAGIFKIMGIGESKEPGGWSWRKHELPADRGQKSHLPE